MLQSRSNSDGNRVGHTITHWLSHKVSFMIRPQLQFPPKLQVSHSNFKSPEFNGRIHDMDGGSTREAGLNFLRQKNEHFIESYINSN